MFIQLSQPWIPVSGDKDVSTSGAGRGAFPWGELSPVFRGKKEGQSVFLSLAVSQVTLIQNNQYAKVEYIYSGMAYSAPLAWETYLCASVSLSRKWG